MGPVSLVSLNLRVRKSPFKVETSICASVCVERRLVGLHRLEGYLLASSIHPDGRKYLSFVALKRVFNPKLFVSVSLQLRMFFHGSWLRSQSFSSPGYSHVQIPDDWFIQAPSHSLVLQALETAVHLCQDLGVLITWEKSSLLPSQRWFIWVLLWIPLSSGLLPPSREREAMLNRRSISVLLHSACLFVEAGICLAQVNPHLDVWSDPSDVG